MSAAPAASVPVPPGRPVVVLGGANVDVKARSNERIVAATSNPGRTVTAAGGVGRNMAENLARLGTCTELVASIGADPLGDWLVDETARAGVRLSGLVRSTVATGTYTAVLDSSGELVVAVADMAATDSLAVADIEAVAGLLRGAAMLVVDANLAAGVLCAALEIAASARVPVVLDPVSVAKAERLRGVLDPARPVFCLTPNRDELAAVTGRSVEVSFDAAVAALRSQGVANVWVRLGAAGSVWFGDDEPSYLPAPRADIRDVTGAGDSMAAAFVHALLRGRGLLDAARFAHAAAALTIESAHTVRPDLTEALVDEVLHDPHRRLA